MKEPHEKLRQATELIREIITSAGMTPDEVIRRMRCTERRYQVTKKQFDDWTTRDPDWYSSNPIIRAARFSLAAGSDLPIRWTSARVGGSFLPGQEFYREIHTYSDLYFDACRNVSILRGVIEKALSDDRMIDSQETLEIALEWIRFRGWADGMVAVLGGDRKAELKTEFTGIHDVIGNIPSYRVVRRTLDHSTKSAAEIATDCGFATPPSVNKWGEESGRIVTLYHGSVIDETRFKSGSPNPFDYLIRFVEVTEDIRPVSLLCEFLDGTLIESDTPVERSLYDLEKTWREVDTELHEMMAAIGNAVRDDRLDQGEAANIAREWQDVRSWMESFLSACSNRQFAGVL